MSEPIPGMSQPDRIALWKGFVQKTFKRTNFKTTFNGKMRNVFTDGKNLIVLDELHGELEILAMQDKPGPAKHLGSQEIEIVQIAPPQKFKRGKLKIGGKTHKFELT